ncbi:MAG: hypothetical protein ACI8W8_004356 [Rhodothermales bacterium]|jgi:hypothetical protein
MDARLAQHEHGERSGDQFVGRLLATLEAERSAGAFVGQVVGRAAAEESTPAGPLRFWPVLVAAMFVMGLLLGLHLAKEPVPPASETAFPVAGDGFVALLSNEAGMAFVDGMGPSGVRFLPGHYELTSGAIHLRFSNGADVIMRAPASFDIDNAFHVRVQEGRMRAIVPPSAHGFTIATPGVDYEDLGTEFALAVDRNGSSKLHVLDGRVDAKRPGSEDLISSVTAGQSVQVTNGVAEQTPPPDLQQYPTPGSIGFLRWQAQRQTFGDGDPDLLAYYPFIEAEALGNEAANPVASDGQIHGARWVSGRWPGKSALLFDRNTDFVELDIPGEYEEMSFAAWLKIDGLDLSHNPIFNSNGWEAGDVHWQIFRSGPMSINYLGAQMTHAATDKAVPTDQWVHLAGTISRSSQTICLYVNGELARSIDFVANRSMRPGRGRLGGWLMEAEWDRTPIRSLRGKMDEFAIWKRALTATEVGALVEAGKPSVLWAMEGH